MASQLNSYRNFIDIKTKEGQALVSNAIDKYVSPLTGDDRISLSGTRFRKLKDNLLRLSSRFGYDYLIKVINTVRTVNATGNATYFVPINMLERYSDDNVILAQKHASLTWGDRSFTIMATNTIGDLTAANGFLTAGGAMNVDGKEPLVLARICPNFKVDMYTEITKAKKLTISQ